MVRSIFTFTRQRKSTHGITTNREESSDHTRWTKCAKSYLLGFLAALVSPWPSQARFLSLMVLTAVGTMNARMRVGAKCRKRPVLKRLLTTIFSTLICVIVPTN